MISLGLLKKSAQFFHGDSFSVWDTASQTFRSGFTGRLYPFDRFKTIYHRPTRRETLGIPTDFSIPVSKVIRHDASDEVFIIGETLRISSNRNRLYDRAHSLHRPIGLFSVVRPTIQGSGDDLGALSNIPVGSIWADLELRTSERENDAYEKYKGKYFITFPDGDVQVKRGDFLSWNGPSFRVEERYMDGGYQMARADEMEDKREVLTYKLPTGTGAGFDPSTGTVTRGQTVDRLFSAIVSPVTSEEEDKRLSLSGRGIKAFVEFSHIGFQPRPEQEIVRGANSYIISTVKSDPESEQWILTCRRGT